MKRALIVGAALTLASGAAAQEPSEPVFVRARQLVVNGNGAAGRLLLDSVIAATPAETSRFAEALYWRASLAATSADAERDYRRLIVEYPGSPRSGAALFQLAQLESARGDRAAATNHLEQFLLDNPTNSERPRAALLYVRLLFEQNELPRGCSTLRKTLSDLPAESVELRNQLEYYQPRCAAADASPAAAVPVAPVPVASVPVAPMPAEPVGRDSTPRTVAPKRPEAAGRFTLQIAAYKSRAEAEALARRLKARDIEARVVPASKLFRVRVGRYATRTAAIAAQQQLKARKITAIVADIGPDDK